MIHRPYILLVDDDELNREVLAEALKEEPYHLVQAASGAQAFRIMRESSRRFDVIVLDRLMPDMNGLEVMGKLKAHEQWQWIPVIMATGAAAPQEICEGMEAGVFYYLSKPFTASVLVRMIQAAVEEGRKWRRIQESLEAPSRAMDLIQSGQFYFHTMEEGYALAIFLAQACSDPDKVAFGLNELLGNAVEHGNLGIGFDEKTRLQGIDAWEREIRQRLTLPLYAQKKVEVVVERQIDFLVITIRDEGNGFNWREYDVIRPDRLLESHGRGIAMAKALSFEEMEFLGIGNSVRCVARLREASGKVRDRIGGGHWIEPSSESKKTESRL
jgi:CheY-like chemotaxis protein